MERKGLIEFRGNNVVVVGSYIQVGKQLLILRRLKHTPALGFEPDYLEVLDAARQALG